MIPFSGTCFNAFFCKMVNLGNGEINFTMQKLCQSKENDGIFLNEKEGEIWSNEGEKN